MLVITVDGATEINIIMALMKSIYDLGAPHHDIFRGGSKALFD
jgi:hypothetical protein